MNIEELKNLLSFNDYLPFFDLNVVLNLFPNIKQIEYFNPSFQPNKSTHELITQILNYCVKFKHHRRNDLKYIVIHHLKRMDLKEIK